MDWSLLIAGYKLRRIAAIFWISGLCSISSSNGHAQIDSSFEEPVQFVSAVPNEGMSLRTADRKPARRIVGWLEDVLLIDAKVHLNAVMHTGVIVSAINALNLENFVRNGSAWARFSVRRADGEAVTIERPVVRFYRLRTEGAPDKKRPIVQLKLCVAGYVEDADFILRDKTSKGYSVVLGRSFLARKLLIDPSRKFVGRGAC